MNKNAIQKFAVWARTEMIAQVKQRAYQYDITETSYGEENAVTVNGRALSADEQRQRAALVQQIKAKGYSQVMEEVAYTWFNRFIALRFMEVNNVLPSHIRVFSDVNGDFKPEILNDVLHLELDGLDKQKVASYIEQNQTDDLYRYLLLIQCNALNSALPGMFERLGSYTELLLPNNILKADGILGRLVDDIPEEDWHDQVQIIGWLYQYYISEKHDQVVNINKSAVRREDIPAATQLFTTDWVVRYMVDNSLGRYWIERHPESKLREKLRYFVMPKSGEMTYVDEKITPQELTFFDPCMGSGHILVYAFDVLMEIYKECGYGERDAAAEIVKNNLFGFDIDPRCSQLAYFTIMMKTRSYDRRFFTRDIQPQVYYPRYDEALLEYGSLLQVEVLDEKPIESSAQTLFEENYEVLMNDWNYRRVLSQHYAVVCTNPPYLNKYNSNLKKFVNQHYKAYAGDLFSVYIYRNFDFCKENGYSAFMTPFVWMFIKTYENLRTFIIENKSITSLIQMEYSAFEEATVPICSFVLQNGRSENRSLCFRLSDFKGGMEVQRQKVEEALHNPECGYFYEAQQSNFSKIPGSPVAYWVSDQIILSFQHPSINRIGTTKQGLATGDNDEFLRLWHEISVCKIGFNVSSRKEALKLGKKWFPCNKGGQFRKWYGNNEYVVNWEDDGKKIRNFRDQKGKLKSRPQNMDFYFREGITWSTLSSGNLSMRFTPKGFLFETKGSMCFFRSRNDELYVLGLTNSKVIIDIVRALSPTLDFHEGPIGSIPVIIGDKELIRKISAGNIRIAKEDWDSYETSWDFKINPILKFKNCFYENTIKDIMTNVSFESIHQKFNSPLELSYLLWKGECNQRFEELKKNEEELNRLFISIYGLHDELTPEVADKDVTVYCIYDTKEDVPESLSGSNYVLTKRDVVVNFISYAVGCMFGRYSLSEEGLAFAGGEWDDSKYMTFIPDKDNIIPICDDDYFEDDITGLFVQWVEVVYGKETLEENLSFIADALGSRGASSREVIRKYFLNDFYKDHCKMYSRKGSGQRPIYWLFDSGKKNGFKALIYMHRYQPDLLARMRTDYVHEQQERYRTQLAHIDDLLPQATGSERVKLTKQQKKLQDQSLEIQQYEEKIHHLADQNIVIDLDDGVKHNYALFADVLAKVK